MNINASQFYSNYSDNSSSTITVDGENSKFTINDQTTTGGEEKYNTAHFGANGNNASAQLKITNGGLIAVGIGFVESHDGIFAAYR